jgi:hypothetical protein
VLFVLSSGFGCPFIRAYDINVGTALRNEVQLQILATSCGSFRQNTSSSYKATYLYLHIQSIFCPNQLIQQHFFHYFLPALIRYTRRNNSASLYRIKFNSISEFNSNRASILILRRHFSFEETPHCDFQVEVLLLVACLVL